MSHQQTQASKKSEAYTPDAEALFLDAVIRARNGLRFGSIEITIHAGKVTQIERKEKFRF